MKRTTITLSDELASAVAREARRRSQSVSEVTREALTEHLGLGGEGARKLPFAALGESGHRTTARDIEDILESDWQSDRGR
jgi:predicted transcriptional regulator